MRTARLGTVCFIPFEPKMHDVGKTVSPQWPNRGPASASRSYCRKCSPPPYENTSHPPPILIYRARAKLAHQAFVGMSVTVINFSRFLRTPTSTNSFVKATEHHASPHERVNSRSKRGRVFKSSDLERQATCSQTTYTPNATQARNCIRNERV